MDRETVLMKKIIKLCDSLCLEPNILRMRVECLMMCYDAVTWANKDKLPTRRAVREEPKNGETKAALQYLSGFDPTDRVGIIRREMVKIFDAELLADLVGSAVRRVESYPVNKPEYVLILENIFSSKRLLDKDHRDKIHLGKTTYGDRKKEAAMLFGAALWGVVIPARLAQY